jgi:hypothetical protein
MTTDTTRVRHRSRTPQAAPAHDDELILGASEIGRAIGMRHAGWERQIYYWLECGRVPGAFKIGKLWAIYRRDARRFGQVQPVASASANGRAA